MIGKRKRVWGRLLSMYCVSLFFLLAFCFFSSNVDRQKNIRDTSSAEVARCLQAQKVITLSASEDTADTSEGQIEDLLEEGRAFISRILGDGWEDFEFGDFFDMTKEVLYGGFADALSFFALMLGAGVIFTLLSLFFEGTSAEHILLGNGASHTVELVLLCSVTSLLFPHIRSALEAVRAVSGFCEGILPVFISTDVLSGMEQGASFTASTFGILLALVEEGIEKLALPALALLLATSLIPTPSGEIFSFGERVYKFYLSSLTLFSVIISTAFALQNTITLGVDRATLRALRYGVGSMIPIVGQTVAGTLSALSGGVLYVKSTLGVGTLVAIFTLALPPLLRLLLCRLALSLPSMLVGAMGEGGGMALGRLYRTIRRLVDTTLALVALSTALFLFVVILFMKSTVSLV